MGNLKPKGQGVGEGHTIRWCQCRNQSSGLLFPLQGMAYYTISATGWNMGESTMADFLRVFKQRGSRCSFPLASYLRKPSLFLQHPCEKSRWEEKAMAMAISLSLGSAGTPMNCFLWGLVYSGLRSQFGNRSRGECCPEICGLIAPSDWEGEDEQETLWGNG